MTAARFRLCVDYGTSNTVAMLGWPDGRVRPLLFDGSPLLPSAVFATPDGRLVVGRDAERSARLDPASYEPNPKRMVDAGELLLGQRAYPVAELMAAALRRVYTEAVRIAGEEPAEVTITYPAVWGSVRRGVLELAAARAGIHRPVLVPEPAAAAAYFVTVLGHRVAVGQSVAVYDLGAGTFDVSVVRRTPEGFEPVAVGGLDEFGGLDLDAVVVERVGAAIAPIDPAQWRRLASPSGPDDSRSFRMLWDDAKAAKEMLSRQPVASLHVPLVNREVHVTRDEFEQAARPLLERTVTVALETFGGSVNGTVAGVFLVGGSSRIPLVATLLHQRLGIAPTAIEQPETVVAEGGLHLGRRRQPEPMAAERAFAAAETSLAPPADSLAVSGSPVAAGRRRRRLATGIVAVVVVLALAIGGALWWIGRGSPAKAFGSNAELRDFASRFLKEADDCAEAVPSTYRREVDLVEPGPTPFPLVVRCTASGWLAYFYDAGAGTEDLRVELYHQVLPKAHGDGASWSAALPGITARFPDHPTYLELTGGDGRQAIYWEPGKDQQYSTRLAAVLLGTNRDTRVEDLRATWQKDEK